MLFTDFVRNCFDPIFKPQYFFNKFLIKDFLEKYVNHFNISHELDDKTDEYYSSTLFKNYISWVKDINQIYSSINSLIGRIYT